MFFIFENNDNNYDDYDGNDDNHVDDDDNAMPTTMPMTMVKTRL